MPRTFVRDHGGRRRAAAGSSPELMGARASGLGPAGDAGRVPAWVPPGGSTPIRRFTFLSLPAGRLARAAPVAAGLALAAAAGPASAAQAADGATTTTFTYTGSEQTYTVPAGATAVTVTALGAPGGTGFTEAGTGGHGAAVTATVPLPAGTTTLYVEANAAAVRSRKWARAAIDEE